MSRVYDAEKEAELESEIQTLEEGIAEQSKLIADFEGKDMDEGSNSTDRAAAVDKHTRLTMDHRTAMSKLEWMHRFKPADKLPEVEENPMMSELNALLRGDKGNGDMVVDMLELSDIQRAQMLQRSDVTGNAAGAAGGAIETRTQPTIIDSLRAYGAGLDVISVFHTPDGNEMQFPVTDNTQQTGSMLADEGSTISTVDPNAVTSANLTTKRFTSNFIPVSNVLIQDAVYDIVGHTMMQCARRIGRAVSDKIVNGVPNTDGIDGIANIGTEITLSSNTGISLVSDIVKLEHSIDRAYLRGEMGLGSTLAAGSGLTNMSGFTGFIVSYDMLRILRTAVDSENRPIWQPSAQAGAPSMLFGTPVMVVDEMDTFAANKKPIAFGNFSYIQGRFAKELKVTRFYDSATAATDHTSFLGITRFGARSTITPVSSKNPAIALGKTPT